MDEFGKARLRLLSAFLVFVAVVFLLIFGIVKGCEVIAEKKQAELPPLEEPFIEPSAKNQKNSGLPSKTENVPPEITFDRSSAFYGIRSSWKKYRLPKCGILLDATNRKLLWSYHADKSVPIASMSKMMTIFVSFDEMSKLNGVVNLNSRVKISRNSATGCEGGFGFMPGDVYTVGDLMQAATVRSANDAAGALAVYFGGTEAEFVKKMNEKAVMLGMKNTSFINPHGLPQREKDNLSTMNDMLILSLLMLDNP